MRNAVLSIWRPSTIISSHAVVHIPLVVLEAQWIELQHTFSCSQNRSPICTDPLTSVYCVASAFRFKNNWQWHHQLAPWYGTSYHEKWYSKGQYCIALDKSFWTSAVTLSTHHLETLMLIIYYFKNKTFSKSLHSKGIKQLFLLSKYSMHNLIRTVHQQIKVQISGLPGTVYHLCIQRHVKISSPD